MTATATESGTFRIGGDLEVTRLGFGAMRVTGDGIWGARPSDQAGPPRAAARLPELGVDFIDTADSYGPYVSEDLIPEALHPYGAWWSRPRAAHPARAEQWHPSAGPSTCASAS